MTIGLIRTIRHGWMSAVLVIGAIVALSGCATPMFDPDVPSLQPKGTKQLMKPVVAVTDFENKSGFTGTWKLGSGMADVLVTELLDSDRIIVLERERLRDVIQELQLQNNNLFREEGKASLGRLKTAKYLLRGAVTDFTVTRDTSGWFGLSKTFSLWGRGQVARVTLHVLVVDVETGEVIGSFKSAGKASSGLFGGAVNYKDVNFGGEAFFRTPLGKATEEAMRSVVKRALKVIPDTYWEPRVALAEGGDIVVNGGENVGMRLGSRYSVRGEGRVITDPLTGDVIERREGPVKGYIEVTDVRAFSAHGRLLDGSAERGDRLEPLSP